MPTLKTLLPVLFCLAAGASGPHVASAAPEDKKPAAETVRGAETPEAAFAGFRDAAVKGDWEAAFRVTTPESRNAIVGGMLGAARMGALGDEGKALAARTADPQKLDELIAAVNRTRREDQPAAIGKLAALVKDKPAFVKEVLELFRKRKQENVLVELEGSALDRLKVQGDAATADITKRTERGGWREDVAFRKIDGRWYVDKR